MPKTLSGNLDTFSLADLLQWLEINGLSGRVTLGRGAVRRTIDLKGGSIVFVSSTRPDERLGAFLAARGYLPEPAVYELLAENFVTGTNLTRLILDRGLMTRERLAEAVETLAIQVLLDLFHWGGATFEFDPLEPPEDFLRIQLSLRGQVLAFHGAKSVDDSGGMSLPEKMLEDTEEPWERDFHAEALAGTFWAILESIPTEGVSPGAVRDRFYVFNLFASEVRRRLKEPFRPYPIFDDTAGLLLAALDDGGDPDRLVQVSALDPFLTANVLHLGNALRQERRGLLATAREAAAAMGHAAIRRYAELLAAPLAPKTPSTNRMERVIRRASLSTAVAGSHLSASYSVNGEYAYTLGLLEPLAGYDLLKLLITVDFEPGPFRAAVLERFRSLFGRELARKLSLPREFEAVLGSTGRISSGSPASEQLVFFAKQLVRAEQIGQEWTSEDPEMADRYASFARDPELPAQIARSTETLYEILQL